MLLHLNRLLHLNTLLYLNSPLHLNSSLHLNSYSTSCVEVIFLNTNRQVLTSYDL